MKPSCFVVLVLGACASAVHAQDARSVYSAVNPNPEVVRGLALIDVSDLFEPGLSDTATKVFGYPGKSMGLASAVEPRKTYGIEYDRSAPNNRAWGLSIGLESGPVTFRVAHQNKHVAKVNTWVPFGIRMDAKNTTVAAHVDLGRGKAYAAYSANRGWGSSPLWNPDNPYGALLASTPSTDSRDVLVGVAVPYGATTLLASFVRKNDRDLANRDADMFAVGATYSLSRRTDFYAAYSHIELRNGNVGNFSVDGGAKGFSAINVGMRHSF